MHNRRTYPHLLRLFDDLGVSTQESEMSMSVGCDGCGLEYAGPRGPAGLLARTRNAVRPSYLRMPAEVPVFHRAARRLLAHGAEDTFALGEFLDREGFSLYFRAHLMTPVVARPWSTVAGSAAIRTRSPPSASTPPFRRMWTLYLAYSEAGFRSGFLDVQQYLFTKEDPTR